MKLLVGNWKMNLGPRAGRELAGSLSAACLSLKRAGVWLAPPFTTIPAVADVLAGSTVRVGAQNVYGEDHGAFTGEISVPMLRELGCSFALVGHSERRHIFKEPDALIVRRARGALARDFTTIFCLGEKQDDRDNNRTGDVLAAQLAPLLDGLPPAQLKHLLIAYEPVWAIGSGRTPSLSEIESAHAGITEEFTARRLAPPGILYGGSVTPDNAAAILGVPGVHGALIGGASQVLEKFAALIRIAEGI